MNYFSIVENLRKENIDPKSFNPTSIISTKNKEEHTKYKNTDNFKDNKVEGYDLIHNYNYIDEWDGDFCPDYCIGCGSCSHFPKLHAVLGFKQKIKIIIYYCKNCYNNDDERIITYLLPRQKNREELSYDLRIFKSDKTCDACKTALNKNNIEYNYEYYDKIICKKCAKNNNIIDREYERCSDKFYCECCRSEYKIIPSKNINCEDISKLKTYESRQVFIDKDGNIKKKIVKENVD
jgi:hypothetical protein